MEKGLLLHHFTAEKTEAEESQACSTPHGRALDNLSVVLPVCPSRLWVPEPDWSIHRGSIHNSCILAPPAAAPKIPCLQLKGVWPGGNSS